MDMATSHSRPKKVAHGPVLALWACLVAALLLAPSLARAGNILTEVEVGKSVIMTLKDPVDRVSLTDTAVADVVVISTSELQINGKKAGITSLIIWDKTGKKTFFDVNVLQGIPGIDQLKDRIMSAAPGDDVRVSQLKNTVIVSGSVSSYERFARIDNMLKSFGKSVTSKEVLTLQSGIVKEVEVSGGEGESTIKFLNLLEVINIPQVELNILVASVDRQATQDLGINWALITEDVALFSTVGSAFPIDQIRNLASGSHFSSGQNVGGANSSGTQQADNNIHITNNPNFGVIHGPSGTAFLIRALGRKGLAKILAEPKLIVKSGESGSFLAGGSIPIPVVQSLGVGSGNAITVQYQPFGVKLNFKPLVTEDGVVRLKLDPAEVSALDNANAVQISGFNIPALRIDTVSTSVDLKEGEAFVIAGLIDNEWSKTLQKFPILGDIPIIGAFFREQVMLKNERELVFFVTPKIIKPVLAQNLPAVPGVNEPTPEQNKDLDWIPGWPTKRSIEPEKLH